MERKTWWPFLVPGSLAVTPTREGERASLTFDAMWGIQPMHVAVEPASGDQARFSIEVAPVSPTTEVASLMDASELKAGRLPRRS